MIQLRPSNPIWDVFTPLVRQLQALEGVLELFATSVVWCAGCAAVLSVALMGALAISNSWADEQPSAAGRESKRSADDRFPTEVLVGRTRGGWAIDSSHCIVRPGRPSPLRRLSISASLDRLVRPRSASDAAVSRWSWEVE